MTILEDIEKRTIDLLLDEPFYAHLIAKIIKSTTQEKTSIDISLYGKNHIQLLINEVWWVELENEKQKVGAVKHQVLHIMFKHIFRTPAFKDKILYALAADLVVNQHLSMAQRYQGVIIPQDLPEFGLETNQTLEYYYEKLLVLQKWILPCANDRDWEALRNSLCKCYSQNTTNNLILALQNCGSFLNDQLISRGEKEVLNSEIDKWMLDAYKRLSTKQQGSIPMNILEHLLAIEKMYEEKIHWRRILKIFAETSSSTYLKNTIKHTSKRYGTTPGIKIKKRNKLLVVIDTSGSISSEELIIFFSEIFHIWKKGAEIKIIECDCEIANIYLYKGKTPTHVKGRGGTDFNPPLVWANKEYKPDGIIYFTDGCADVPTTKTKAPLLWLITKDGIDEKSDFWKSATGRKLKIN